MTTPIRVTGTIDDQEYSLNVAPGDVWPSDRSPASSKAAAVVLCSVGLTYAPAPSCSDVVLSLDDPKTVLACLVNETKILSITPEVQFVPSASGPPGSADGPVWGEPSRRADFADGLSLLGDFGAKAYAMTEPRDERGRWIAVQSAIASLKVAAHSLLRQPGVRQDSGLQENLANAAGAARTRDHVGTRAALDRVADALNRLGPQVVKPFPARSHPQVEHVQSLLDEALQAHADLVPASAQIGRAPRDAQGYVPGHDD